MVFVNVKVANIDFYQRSKKKEKNSKKVESYIFFMVLEAYSGRKHVECTLTYTHLKWKWKKKKKSRCGLCYETHKQSVLNCGIGEEKEKKKTKRNGKTI